MLATSPAEASAQLARAYDQVRYPSSAFPHTHPERMWTLATLHGLAAPPPAGARVLELGGGDGLNAMAMAVGLPGACFRSIDVAAEPVRAGQTLAAAAGLGNVRIELGDVVALADSIDGEYDYVIAHGLYAWVPETVRHAVMLLIGRVLAADGVAFVSYNAEPGGRIRSILRDLALADLDPALPEEERLEAAIAALACYGAETGEATPLIRALREHATRVARRGASVLAHDEFGPFFAPQSVTAVVATAAAAGLAYLDDAESGELDEGFFTTAPADFTRHLQSRDYRAMRFFRNSLFVRAERPLARRLDPEHLAALWLSSPATRDAADRFSWPGGSITMSDGPLGAMLDMAIAAAPFRLRIADLGLDAERVAALFQLYAGGAIRLHGMQTPGVADSPRPCASPLARAQVAAGLERIARLNGDIASLDQAIRSSLLLFDGSRDMAALAAPWAALPISKDLPLAQAVQELGQISLLLA